MAADEILGISGQMDISDIQKSFDQLINSLDQLNVKTKDISTRMTAALNEISQSASTDGEKTQHAIQALKDGIAEINASLKSTPEDIKNVATEAKTAEETINRLKTKLSSVDEGSHKWQEINTQIKTQQELTGRLNSEYENLVNTFGSTQQYIGTLSVAIDALNAGRTISTAATGASAAAHGTAAVAVTTEAVAHGANAEKISNETQSVKENIDAYNSATKAQEEHVKTISSEADALDRVAERIKSGNVTQDEYVKNVTSATERLQALRNEYTQLSAELNEYKKQLNTFEYKNVNGNFQEVGQEQREMNEAGASAVSQRLNDIREEINEIENSLNKVQQTYSKTSQKAEDGTKKEVENTNKTRDAIREKEDELKKLNEQLNLMEAHHSKGMGDDLFAAIRKRENPFGVVKDFFAEGDDIKAKKQQIAELTEELEKLRTEEEKIKTSSQNTKGTGIWEGQSKEQIEEATKANKKLLDEQKAAYYQLIEAGKANTSEAERNLEFQKALSEEIRSGEEELKKMSSSYKEVSSEAENAANKTKETNNTSANTTGTGIWEGQSKEQIAEAISQNIEQLRIEKKELSEITTIYGSHSEKAEQKRQAIKEITKETENGKEELKKMGTSYDEVVKKAKEAAKQTKDIGESAGASSKKISGMFSNIKSAFSGAMKGNFSSFFGIIGKIGVYGGAIVSVGKALQTLTEKAEAFRVAIQPLEHYVSSDKIDGIKQNIIALSSTTTKSVTDMAGAAQQFVKVWEGIGESTEALTDMIKSANEFGALSGQTSTDAAKSMSNLASEYHLTALEATEMANMIANAAHNSTSSFSEISNAISSAGSTAATYGISFRDMATIIGYSSNQFGGAQKAASKFSRMLMSMSKMQDKYNPSVVGTVEALKNLNKAYKNGEPVLNKFMGLSRSTAAYFIKNADAIEQYYKTIDNAAAKKGMLEDISTRASANLAKLNNAWDGFLTALNANITPVLTNILKFFTKIIGGAQETAEELSFLEKWDKKTGNTKLNAIGGTSPSGFNVNAAAAAGNRNDALKTYREQANKLKKYYEIGVRNALRKYKGVSIEGAANAGENMVRAVLKNNSANYSQFTPDILKDFFSRRRQETRALMTKPKNSKADLGGLSIDTSKDTEKRERERAEEQLNEDLINLQQKNNEQQVAIMQDGTQKKIKEIENDYKKREEEIKKQEKKFKKNNKIAKKATNENGLTTDQENALTEARKLNEQKKNKSTENLEKESLKNELLAMTDYLKEYGTLQEKKYAIAKEYAQKIKEVNEGAGTPEEKAWKVKALEQERDNATGKAKAQSLAMDIDWGATFQGVGNVLKDIAKETLDKVEEYMKTDEFKSSSAENKKTYVDLRNNLKQEVGGEATSPFNFRIWSTIEQNVRDYQASVKNLKEKTEAHEAAVQELEAAQKRLAEATDETAQDIADVDVKKAKADVDKTASDLSTAQDKKDKAQQTLTDNTDKASQGLQNFASSLQEMSNGTLYGFANGIVKLVNTLKGGTNNVGDVLGELGGKVGGLIGAILQIIDALGDDPTGFIDNLLQKVSNIVSTVISQLPDLIITIIKDIGNIVGSLIEGVGSLLGFGSIFGGNNTVEMQKIIDKLNNTNETLIEVVKALTEKMEEGTFAEAISSHAKAKAATKLEEKNSSQAMIAEAQKHGSGRHSLNYSVEDNTGWEIAMKKVSAIVGKKIVKSTDFLSLSAAELDKIQKEDWRLWDDIMNEYRSEAGNGRSDKIPDMLQDYIDKYADAYDELDEELMTKLTGISFDEVKDNFKSMLSDMTKSSEDFANNFEEMMKNAVVNSLMDNVYNDKIKKWYEKVFKAIKSRPYDPLDKSTIEELRKEWEDISNEAVNDRNQVLDIMGYQEQSSQSATSKGIEAITADQASSLIGIGYAMQIALEQGNTTRELISSDISVMRSYAEKITYNISEMRDIQYEGLNQLQKIEKNTAPIILISGNIEKMYKLMQERY